MFNPNLFQRALKETIASLAYAPLLHDRQLVLQ